MVMETQNSEMNIEETLLPEELTARYSKEVADFFEVEPDGEIKVRIFDSMQKIGTEFKEYTGLEPPVYLKGFSPDGEKWKEIWVVKSGVPDEHGKIISRDYLNRSIKHELVHTYEKIFYKANEIDARKVPIWLREGMALYIAEQEHEYVENIDVEMLRNMGGLDAAKFKTGYKIVSQIMEKYGKEKLMELLRMADKESILIELKKMFTWLK